MSNLPKKVVNDVKKFLSKYDQDKSYTLTYDEVLSELTKEGCDDAVMEALFIFSVYDKDNDGKITINEIGAETLERYVKDCQQKISKEIQQFLNEYDENKDNKITYDEVYKVFEKKVNKDAKLFTEMLFADMDANKDKVITLEEMRRKCESNYQLPAQ